MDNYEFVAQWVVKRLPSGGRVLDYGCGAGQIVKHLRACGADAWGCDVFYEGGSYADVILPDARPFISHMGSDSIPFPDGHFDIIVSNQVLEHVPDMDAVLREISRVLKPGGISLNLFPDRGVFREGHCGIAFLHWFPKGSAARVYYAAAIRALGFGYFKEKAPTVMGWARYWCKWLDDWTHYRPHAEIVKRLTHWIGATDTLEVEWLSTRYPSQTRFIPAPLQRLIVRKLGGMTWVSVKHQS